MSTGNLRHHAISGVQWAVMGRLLKSLLGVGTMAVLSYYLTPAEFGNVLLVTIVAGFAQLFVDSGLRVALVQAKSVTRIQQDTVFWSTFVLSCAVALVVFALAGPISMLMRAPDVEPLIRWITLVFPISAAQSVSMTILERKFAFKRIAFSDLSGAVVGAIVAIGLAMAGWSMGALIAQQIVLAITTTLIICSSARFMPAFNFSWTDFRSLISYGGYVMLTNVVGYLNNHSDRAIIGGVISPTALGYFSMARMVIDSPFKIIVQMAYKVLFPVLSSVQDDLPRLGNAYLRIQFTMAAVMMPVCIGIAAISEPLVAILFAPQWAPVAPLIMLVALQMPLVPIQRVNQVTLAATGRAKFQFWWSLMTACIALTAISFIAPYGLEAAIIGRIGIVLILTPVLSTYTQTRLGLSPLRLLKALFPPVAAAALMFTTVTAVLRLWDLPNIAQIAIGVTVGVAIYTPAIFLIAPEQSKYVFKAFLKRNK